MPYPSVEQPLPLISSVPSLATKLQLVGEGESKPMNVESRDLVEKQNRGFYGLSRYKRRYSAALSLLHFTSMVPAIVKQAIVKRNVVESWGKNIQTWIQE